MQKTFKYFVVLFCMACCCLLTGCFQASNDDDLLRTVPVTNNPNNLGSRPQTPAIPY